MQMQASYADIDAMWSAARTLGQRIKAALENNEKTVARMAEVIEQTKVEVARSNRLIDRVRAQLGGRKDKSEVKRSKDPG